MGLQIVNGGWVGGTRRQKEDSDDPEADERGGISLEARDIVEVGTGVVTPTDVHRVLDNYSRRHYLGCLLTPTSGKRRSRGVAVLSRRPR